MNDFNKRVKYYLWLRFDNRELSLFMRFLKERKALKQYIINRRKVIEHPDGDNAFAYSTLTDFGDVLNYSFLWSETEEGRMFWCDLHEEWYNQIIPKWMNEQKRMVKVN